jgi:hypothetical protein
VTLAADDFSAIRARMGRPAASAARPAATGCAKLFNGLGAPPPGVGQPGDFWIDRDQPGHPLYGPKTEAGWPSTPITSSAPVFA